MLAHDASVVPGTRIPAFRFCFPPPIMAGHIVQHFTRYKAHAVVLFPDVKAQWFPFGATRHSKVNRGGFSGPSGCGRVLSVAQFGWWSQELAVPSLGKDSARVNFRTTRYGVTITYVLATVAQ